MWASMLYLMPIAAMLSTMELSEEVELRGQMQEEFQKLLARYIPQEKFRIRLNDSLHATINATYPAGSNLWTIFDGIIQRYHLIVDIKPNEAVDGLVVQFLEGPSWQR